jgi:FkbM family methyltransferase
VRADAVSRITRLYPLLSGCGTLANHPFIDILAGRPEGDAWAEVEGGRLSVSLSDYVGRAAYFVGDLDRKVSAIIDRFVKPGDTVLDIGANIGLVSLRLAKRVGPSGVVHAFEPNPTIADRLVSSLRASDATNVKVHRFALGEAVGTLPLSVPEGNAGMGSLVAGRVCGEACDVAVQRLDDFDFGPIDFIKMDVEGFEENVFRGFSRTLERQPPKVILFEQNDEHGHSIPLLQAAGYEVSGIAKSLFRLDLRPVSQWSPKYHDYVALSA